MNELNKYNTQLFESLKHINEFGEEYWYARELQTLLEYTEWRNFSQVIEKAKIACEKAGNRVAMHFVDVNKSISSGYNTVKEISDFMLSRYACYLIVQNGDSRKEIIALGQTYFAVQTRQRELEDNFEQLSENQKRLAIRGELKEHNKSLFNAAQKAGVKNYGKFYNHGYMGLYNGLTVDGIREIKGLTGKEDVLDHMGSTELAANLFRATQTDEKLRRENIKGEDNANNTHYEVGKKVRETMLELGNRAPEHLPTPIESIPDLKKKQKKQELNDPDQLTLF
ncbi:DNA damage-inducible protein D [Aerococcaceae bacterium NML210727]|nr:DNA damage-inducible protein D [Aerococcaceae bacterium NML210727]MCW6655049.1 DNA damage-inducible protein D [Aerococcaceae bacterium NML201296]